MSNDKSFYWGDSHHIWTKNVEDIDIYYPFAEDITEMIIHARLSSDFLYVHTESCIKQIPLSDGTTNSIPLSNSSIYNCFQVDSNGIYLSYNGDSDGRIIKLSPDGSYTNLATDLNKPGNLTLYDGQLFWAETGFQRSSDVSGAIKCMSVSGGEITVLAEDLTPQCLAVDQSALYYACDGVLYKMNLLTGETNALANNCHASAKPIIGKSFIYWIEPDNSNPEETGASIYKCLKM